MNTNYEEHFVKVKKTFLVHHNDESKRPSWFFSIKDDILFVTLDTHITFFLTKDFVKVYVNFANSKDKDESLEIID